MSVTDRCSGVLSPSVQPVAQHVERLILHADFQGFARVFVVDREKPASDPELGHRIIGEGFDVVDQRLDVGDPVEVQDRIRFRARRFVGTRAGLGNRREVRKGVDDVRDELAGEERQGLAQLAVGEPGIEQPALEQDGARILAGIDQVGREADDGFAVFRRPVRRRCAFVPRQERGMEVDHVAVTAQVRIPEQTVERGNQRQVGGAALPFAAGGNLEQGDADAGREGFHGFARIVRKRMPGRARVDGDDVDAGTRPQRFDEIVAEPLEAEAGNADFTLGGHGAGRFRNIARPDRPR